MSDEPWKFFGYTVIEVISAEYHIIDTIRYDISYRIIDMIIHDIYHDTLTCLLF